MRRCSRTLICAAVATLIANTPALAQERGPVGLGLGVSTSLVGDFAFGITPTIYVPIIANPDLMIEPGIGLFREHDDDETDTFFGIHVGILFNVAGGEDDRIYIGPRLGLLRMTESFDDPDSEDSETNFTIAGVAGGEFFLRELFSLGGEIGLRYLDEDNGSLLSTTTEFRVRWYF